MVLLASIEAQVLWASSLAVVPLAFVVWALCKTIVRRPATRHALWLMVLVSLITPLLASMAGVQVLRDPTDYVEQVSSVIDQFRADDASDATPEVLATPETEHPAEPAAAAPSRVLAATPILTPEPEPAVDQPTEPARAKLPATQPDADHTPSHPRFAEPTPEPKRTKPVRIATSTPSKAKSAISRESRITFDDSWKTHRITQDWLDSDAPPSQVPEQRTAPTRHATALRATHRESQAEEPATKPTRTFVRTSRPATGAQQPTTADATRVEQPTTNDPAHVVELAADQAPPISNEELIAAILAHGKAAAPGSDLTSTTDRSGITDAALPVDNDFSWNTWLAKLGAVRIAVADLPTPPARFWLFGAAAVIGLMVLRVLACRWQNRGKERAPEEICALVETAAEKIGLRRTPETWLVVGRMSPMVSCGMKPSLILPVELWEELDEQSRMGVLLHELAHLKRRDHWVRWVELVVSVLYWWHPVLWWVRHRLREEADLCCDAWVTTLMPSQRRAYAEALVQTRSYLNVAGLGASPTGLRMASGRSRRFARRLTMVMTHRVGPKVSPVGAALAVFVATVGMVVMPGAACPDKHKDKKAPKAPEAPAAPAAPATPAAPWYSRALPALPGEAPIAPAVAVAPAVAAVPAAPSVPSVAYAQPQAWRGPDSDDENSRLKAIERRLAEMERMLGLRADQKVMPSRTATFDSGFSSFQPIPDSGEEIARSYKLPSGKLDALTQLMIRDDVPVLVSPKNNELVVYGTARDHEIFAAFVKLVSPETEMSWRSASPKADAAPKPDAAPRAAWRSAQDSVRVAADEQRARAEVLRAHAREQSSHIRALEVEYKRLAKEAERMLDRAERVHERAHEYESKANKYSGTKHDEYMVKADALHAESEALEAEAEHLANEAEQLEDELEMLKDEIEMIEDEAEQCEDEAEDLAEEADEIESEWYEDQDDDNDWDEDEDI